MVTRSPMPHTSRVSQTAHISRAHSAAFLAPHRARSSRTAGVGERRIAPVPWARAFRREFVRAGYLEPAVRRLRAELAARPRVGALASTRGRTLGTRAADRWRGNVLQADCGHFRVDPDDRPGDLAGGAAASASRDASHG